MGPSFGVGEFVRDLAMGGDEEEDGRLDNWVIWVLSVRDKHVSDAFSRLWTTSEQRFAKRPDFRAVFPFTQFHTLLEQIDRLINCDGVRKF